MAILPMKGEVNATSAAKAFAKTNKVKIEDVSGSGQFGRVVLEDVQAHIKKAATAQPAKPKAD